MKELRKIGIIVSELRTLQNNYEVDFSNQLEQELDSLTDNERASWSAIYDN